MSRSLPILALAVALAAAGDARALSFVDDLLVERFEVSGSGTFVDEFDDGVFPSAGWVVPCGAASESGGVLAIGATGPGCGNDLFLALALAGGFTGAATVTADFGLPLPSENEFVGIQVANASGGDRVSLTAGRFGGNVYVAIADESSVVSATLDAEDLPTSFFTLQISLALDVGTGRLIPTVAGSVDGNPLFSLEFAGYFLDPGSLTGGDAYFGEILAGPVVPEPAPAALLFAGVAAGLAIRGRRR